MRRKRAIEFSVLKQQTIRTNPKEGNYIKDSVSKGVARLLFFGGL